MPLAAIFVLSYANATKRRRHWRDNSWRMARMQLLTPLMMAYRAHGMLIMLARCAPCARRSAVRWRQLTLTTSMAANLLVS